jgi:hypothetical protein
VSERRHHAAIVVALSAATLAAACDVRRSVGESDWQTLSTQRQLAGEPALDVELEYAAGRFAVAPAEQGTLYSIDMRYDANVFRPTTEYANGRLKLGLDGRGTMRGRGIGEGHLRVGLNPSIPTELDLRFGAVRAEIELGGIALRRLGVQTGASETRISVSAPNQIAAEHVRFEAGAARFQARGLGNLNASRLSLSGGVGDILLDFGGEWQRDLSASVDVGIGALTLELPRGLGVRVSRSGVLSGFDGQELIRRGNVYYSEDWETAPRKLDITLNAAIGNVRVVWRDDAFTN